MLNGRTHSHARVQPRNVVSGSPPGTTRAPAITYSLMNASIPNSTPIAQNSQPLRFPGRRVATTTPTVPQVRPNAAEAPRKPHEDGTGVVRVAARMARDATEAASVAIQRVAASLWRFIERVPVGATGPTRSVR